MAASGAGEKLTDERTGAAGPDHSNDHPGKTVEGAGSGEGEGPIKDRRRRWSWRFGVAVEWMVRKTIADDDEFG